MNAHTKNTLFHLILMLFLGGVILFLFLSTGKAPTLYVWITSALALAWFAYGWQRERTRIKKHELQVEQQRKENPELAARADELVRIFTEVMKDPPKLRRVTWILHFSLLAIGSGFVLWTWVNNWSAYWSISPDQGPIWKNPIFLDIALWSIVGLLIVSLVSLPLTNQLAFKIYLQLHGTEELEDWKRKVEEQAKQD